jgi:hypothetical protein
MQLHFVTCNCMILSSHGLAITPPVIGIGTPVVAG